MSHEPTIAEAGREVGESISEGGEALLQQVEALERAQHKRCVDHVLAGRTEMHVLCMGFADRLPDLSYEVGHHNPVARSAGPQSRHVRQEYCERVDDGLCGFGRNDTEFSFGFGERGLEAQHRRDLGVDAKKRRHLLVAEEAGEEGMVEGRNHMSKKTVSLSPWRRMSKL